MKLKRTRMTEGSAVYFPSGTKAKIQAVADPRGMSESTFIRMAVLDRLREELSKEDQQQDVRLNA